MDPAKALSDFLAADFFFMAVLTLVGFSYAALWLYSIYHCLTKGPEKDRVLWILVICLAPFFGTIFYFAIGRRRGMPPIAAPPPISSAKPLVRISSVPSTTASLDAANFSDPRKRADAITRALAEESAKRRRS